MGQEIYQWTKSLEKITVFESPPKVAALAKPGHARFRFSEQGSLFCADRQAADEFRMGSMINNALDPICVPITVNTGGSVQDAKGWLSELEICRLHSENPDRYDRI